MFLVVAVRAVSVVVDWGFPCSTKSLRDLISMGLFGGWKVDDVSPQECLRGIFLPILAKDSVIVDRLVDASQFGTHADNLARRIWVTHLNPAGEPAKPCM